MAEALAEPVLAAQALVLVLAQVLAQASAVQALEGPVLAVPVSPLEAAEAEPV